MRPQPLHKLADGRCLEHYGFWNGPAGDARDLGNELGPQQRIATTIEEVVVERYRVDLQKPSPQLEQFRLQRRF
jgi:hypothetical protein